MGTSHVMSSRRVEMVEVGGVALNEAIGVLISGL